LPPPEFLVGLPVSWRKPINNNSRNSENRGGFPAGFWQKVDSPEGKIFLGKNLLAV